MPSSCFVPGCKGNYNGSVKVGSYRIPRDELIRKKWVEVLHRKESDISKYSRDMPFKCVVPQCKSNYKPPYVSCYRFPRDIEKQKIWLKCIHYENYKITESSKVCEIHFQNSDFETEVSAYDPKTDRTITCSLARKRLRKGVVPSLFLPTSDLVPPKRNLTHQNKKQPKGLPVKSGHLKESVKTASLTVRKKEEKSENMVKRKRKSAVTETSNKKVGSTSALNGTQSSNGVTSDKSTEAKSKRSDRPICTNPEAFAFLNVEIKREPLSDDEKQNNPFRNNSEEHISENMQITNVRSVSSERSYTVSPDEVNVARKPDENLDSDFYSKPLSMEQRDKAFGSFVACELSDLHENPTLYMKTKQSILKILTEAHFEQMSSGFEETFLKEISLMKKNQSVIMKKIHDIINSINVHENLEKSYDIASDMKKFIPVSSFVELDKLEDELKDENTFNKMIHFLSKIGGDTCEQATKFMLRRIMTDDLATLFSYQGLRDNRAFRTLEICKAILCAVRLHASWSKSSETEIEKTISNWLRHAKARVQNKKKT